MQNALKSSVESHKRVLDKFLMKIELLDQGKVAFMFFADDDGLFDEMSACLSSSDCNYSVISDFQGDITPEFISALPKDGEKNVLVMDFRGKLDDPSVIRLLGVLNMARNEILNLCAGHVVFVCSPDEYGSLAFRLPDVWSIRY